MKIATHCLICALFTSLLTNTVSAQSKTTKSQLNGQTVADYVDTTAGLNIKGKIFVSKNLNKSPLNPHELTMKLVFTSVTTGSKGSGFVHTRATSQVREDLISNFLDKIPSMDHILDHLPVAKLPKKPQAIASFELHIIKKVEGSLSGFSNQIQQNLVFHETDSTTSGFITIVSASLNKHDTSLDDFKLFLSFLRQFTELASDLNCQNIWVTAKIGKHTEQGICWKNKFIAVN